MDPQTPTNQAPRGKLIPFVIGGVVVVILVTSAALLWHAESKTNKVTLSSEPKLVTVVLATATSYHASRTYIGRLDPWVSASVGPQFVSAYVDTVLVRPGAVVTRGQVLATLDCRNTSATSQAIAMQARSLDQQQKALSNESLRVNGMLDGGFVSPNEAEQKSAQSASKMSELLAEKAKLVGTSLEVGDCILRAPFDGEVANRWIDPGAFVRPGSAIVSVVDRTTVRMTADVPENDFAIVTPEKKIRLLVYATGKEITGTITRRAPAADPGTRTVHVEVDIADPNKEIPVGTTGELRVDANAPIPATSVPLAAATIRDTKATFFTITGDLAHLVGFTTLGEAQGMLYAAPTSIAPGTLVVTEGRALIKEGDHVTYKVEDAPKGTSSAAPAVTPTANETKL